MKKIKKKLNKMTLHEKIFLSTLVYHSNDFIIENGQHYILCPIPKWILKQPHTWKYNVSIDGVCFFQYDTKKNKYKNLNLNEFDLIEQNFMPFFYIQDDYFKFNLISSPFNHKIASVVRFHAFKY